MLHKILSVFIGILFLAFAALQYNDPDPLSWMVLYGGIAVFSFLSVWKRLPAWFFFFPIIGCVVWAVIIFPSEYHGVTGNMEDNPAIEQTREVLGLVIAVVALVYLLVMNRRKPAHNSSS